MRMKSGKYWVATLTAICLLLAQPAFAGISNEELLEKLNKLSFTIQKQQQEIEMLKKALNNQETPVQQVKCPKKHQCTKTASLADKETSYPDWMPEWINRIKVSGDLRLRYEGLYNREQRQADNTLDAIPTRDRYRIRARLFFDGNISDEISTHFMICTNQDGNREATTTNQTFNDDFSDKGIYLHRAYATYKPDWLKGFELTGGKFKNTFLHTDIMWDPDVNPEGIYERYQYSGLGDFRPFIHLGQMAVNEENTQADDANLLISQLGFDWKIGPVSWTLAGSYYNWGNLHNSEFLHLADYKGGGGNTFELDDNGVLQYRYDYNLWEAISTVKFNVGSIPAKLIFDYIVNTADDVPGKRDTAYFAGFKLGKTKKQADWSLFYKYARIEKDSVIGSMNDQDFYGANRKGHRVSVKYMLFNRLQFGTSYFYTDPITDWDTTSVTFGNNRNREHEERLQTELVFKF